MTSEKAGFWPVIQSIGELNPDAGLSHVSGAETLYADSLEMSCRQLQAKCDTMTGALDGGDIKGFAILVHAMKSEMATLGAAGLSGTAARLETAAKSGDAGFCQERFPEFRDRLLRLREQLSAAFPASETAAKEGPGTPEALREGIDKALAAIREYDSDRGLDAVNALLPYDFGEKSNALLSQAAEALTDFNFSVAEDCLRGAG